nr:TRAP transporter small permease subunit [Ohessyouella blattaphilus]
MDKLISWIENIVCVLTLVGIVSIATAGVIARYVFKAGFFWADEVNQALLVAMAMFGSARAVRMNGHTEFTTISSKPKSKKVRIAFRTIIMVITMALLVFLLINLSEYAASGTMLSTVLKIPRMYYYMSMPIGIALCLYEYVRAFKRKVIDDPVTEE